MSNDRNRDDSERTLGRQGPARDDVVDELEALPNDHDDQSAQQRQGGVSRPGSGEEPGTARRAGDASGAPSGPSHLGEAEHAFERSRGEERRK